MKGWLLADGEHDTPHASPAAGVTHGLVHHVVRGDARALARVVERQRHHLGGANHRLHCGGDGAAEEERPGVHAPELRPAPHLVLLPAHLGVLREREATTSRSAAHTSTPGHEKTTLLLSRKGGG